jgi:hypothetical protein
MAIAAQPPEDEDGLLEPQPRLDADAKHDLVLGGVPPAVPGPRHDAHLLPRRNRALTSVDHEGDPSRPDLEVLGAVVVDVLATGNEAARLDDEVDDDALAARLVRRLDQ